MDVTYNRPLERGLMPFARKFHFDDHAEAAKFVALGRAHGLVALPRDAVDVVIDDPRRRKVRA